MTEHETQLRSLGHWLNQERLRLIRMAGEARNLGYPDSEYNYQEAAKLISNAKSELFKARLLVVKEQKVTREALILTAKEKANHA